LHLSLLAAGVGPGDEVITTSMTFVATANAILHSGATPVLADIDPRTMNLDPESVRERLTERTRAIVPVHFAGRPCDMDALGRIVAEHDLQMIEDCAHAVETEYRGRPAGTFGDFGCFSFYATKNVTTGEGGMIVCRDAERFARIKRLALHGLSQDAWRRFGDDGYRHYYATELGFKYNMMDLQAAIGLHQLDRVEKAWERRREIWNSYCDALSGLPIELPVVEEPNTRHAYHLFTIRIDEARTGISRDAFLEGMTANNIGVGVHYVCLAEHPYYRESLGWRSEQVPNAARIGKQTVSLPLSPKLTDDDVRDVIQAVEIVLSR